MNSGIDWPEWIILPASFIAGFAGVAIATTIAYNVALGVRTYYRNRKD